MTAFQIRERKKIIANFKRLNLKIFIQYLRSLIVSRHNLTDTYLEDYRTHCQYAGQDWGSLVTNNEEGTPDAILFKF